LTLFAAPVLAALAVAEAEADAAVAESAALECKPIEVLAPELVDEAARPPVVDALETRPAAVFDAETLIIQSRHKRLDKVVDSGSYSMLQKDCH